VVWEYFAFALSSVDAGTEYHFLLNLLFKLETETIMQFDLRLPIGYLFTALGAMLVLFGLFTANAEMYQRSLGINIDLWWGAFLLIFGLLMAFAARKSQKRMIREIREATPAQPQPPVRK